MMWWPTFDLYLKPSISDILNWYGLIATTPNSFFWNNWACSSNFSSKSLHTNDKAVPVSSPRAVLHKQHIHFTDQQLLPRTPKWCEYTCQCNEYRPWLLSENQIEQRFLHAENQSHVTLHILYRVSSSWTGRHDNAGVLLIKHYLLFCVVELSCDAATSSVATTISYTPQLNCSTTWHL